MNSDSQKHVDELRVDGGATCNDALMQFQADILQIPVVRSKTAETTALGAAYLAGLATGFWNSKDELAEHWRADRRFEPRISKSDAAVAMDRWHEAVGRSLDWAK
jgi:glycerol kinase